MTQFYRSGDHPSLFVCIRKGPGDMSDWRKVRWRWGPFYWTTGSTFRMWPGDFQEETR